MAGEEQYPIGAQEGGDAIERLRAHAGALERRLAEQEDEIRIAHREARVEAALERIRSRATAMRHSDELREVVAIAFTELQELGFGASQCSIGIYDAETKGSVWWMSDKTRSVLPESYRLPHLDGPWFEQVYDAWRRQSPYFVFELSGERKKQHDSLFFSETDFRSIPEASKAMLMAEEQAFLCYASMRHGMLEVSGTAPLSDEKAEIVQRFARTIEQTYTRFLDLQRAEAQAREAQLEAALERVRTRTMAMRSSDELGEVVVLLFEEMKNLGLDVRECVIGIIDPDTLGLEMWGSGIAETKRHPGYRLPFLDHPFYREAIEAWKRGESYRVAFLEGASKAAYERLLFEETELRHLPPETKAAMAEVERVFSCDAYMRHGVLQAVGPAPLSEGDGALLQRFARVFEQTYTRFLDLQHAEAQARESQIEAALERVRTRTMAMHRSDELAETAGLLFDQLVALGVTPVRCNIGIVDPERRATTLWSTTQEGDVIPLGSELPMMDHAVTAEMYEAWEAQRPHHVIEVVGEAREDWVAFVMRHVPFPEYRPETIDRELVHSQPAVFNNFSFRHGFLTIHTDYRLSPGELGTLERFARLFEQTYTRFLDLKRAEEQAREAQVEAALERVRARAMAMHRSEELREVVGVIFEQLQRLEFEVVAVVIILRDPTTDDWVWWMSGFSQEMLPVSYRVPILDGDHPVAVAFTTAVRQGVRYRSWVLEGEEKQTWHDLLMSRTELRLLPEPVKEAMQVLERAFLSDALMAHGALEVAGPVPLPDEKAEILQRFARVLDLTYTRVVDLQQAEARALEATRQASLDRVRAEIASMRTMADLERITPLVWRELTTLGVPFFRCGVFIMDEENERVHTYLTTPNGASLAVLHLPYDGADLTRNTVDHWRTQDVYREIWDRDRFSAWVQSLVEQGYVETRTTYQGGEEPPESLALQFVPFVQGMLYVGSAQPLTDEQIDTVEALADAFAVAYARYEDFRQLETTLSELKSTQAQLIHSEKMASLGQMTAGIAHEIKNPLNFINNFAEINAELADELVEGLASGEDVSDILADLKRNAAQIASHGRRADGIVRAMMQHAKGDTGERAQVTINAFVEEYVNLAYHGMRASRPMFNATVERSYDDTAGTAPVQEQELGRVLLNLLGNAFDAVCEHSNQAATGYKPKVGVSTRRLEDGKIEIRIADNGGGVPSTVRDKIFEPFFTTKPTGQGTGLGLSLSYDIVTQGHGGTLTLESAEGKGATFVIALPARSALDS